MWYGSWDWNAICNREIILTESDWGEKRLLIRATIWIWFNFKVLWEKTYYVTTLLHNELGFRYGVGGIGVKSRDSGVKCLAPVLALAIASWMSPTGQAPHSPRFLICKIWLIMDCGGIKWINICNMLEWRLAGRKSHVRFCNWFSSTSYPFLGCSIFLVLSHTSILSFAKSTQVCLFSLNGFKMRTNRRSKIPFPFSQLVVYKLKVWWDRTFCTQKALRLWLLRTHWEIQWVRHR